MKKNLLLFLGIALAISASAVQKKAVRHTAKAVSVGAELKIDTDNSLFQVHPISSVSPAKIESSVAAKPDVSYKVPQGTLFYGLSNDYYALSSIYGVASPFTNWTFTNTSSGSPVFTWSLDQYDATSSSYIPTTKTLSTAGNNLSLGVTTEGFKFPVLKGTENALDSTFIFGKNYASKAATGYIDAGGASYDNGTRVFNLSNWLKDLAQVTWTFATKDYAFGTGSRSIDAVVAYYEKPQTTLYFEGANFFLGAFSAPKGTIFTLRVITVDVANGFPTMKDTVATSYVPSDSVVALSATAFTMPFKKLVALDKDGLESDIPYLELDEAFVLELSWVNSPDLTIGVRSTYYDGLLSGPLAYYPNHAFTYAPYVDNDNKRTLLKYSWPATLNTSLTNAAYTYLVSETDSVIVASTGGSEVVTLAPYYGGVWVNDSELPAWITYKETEHYVSGNWGTDYALTFAPLPNGVAGRTADVVFYTWGAKKVVHVKQGIVNGISTTTTDAIKAYSTQAGFSVNCPSGYNAVSVYNIAGQLVGEYPLSTVGKSEIPVTAKRGSYILKFSGEKSATLKVIK